MNLPLYLQLLLAVNLRDWVQLLKMLDHRNCYIWVRGPRVDDEWSGLTKIEERNKMRSDR